MSLQSTCIALLLLLITTCTYGQEQPVSHHITGKEGAAGTQVITNEVNTEQYPQVRMFTTVLKEGAPLQGLSAADFRVREDEVDQEPTAVEPQLPRLSVVLALDTSGSMAKRMKETQAAAQVQTRPSSGDAPCYDETALQSVVASLRKNEERFARNLIDSIERDQQRQKLVNDFDYLMAQGSGTEACLLRELGLVHTLFNDQLINSIQRDASRKLLYTKLHESCLPQATDVPPIADCLTLMNSAYEQDLIDSIQRDASRQMLWQALHNLLLARARTDEEIDQALDAVNQLYEKDLINSLQRDATRKALSKK